MRIVVAQRPRKRVVHVHAAVPTEHAMRSEQSQYTVQSIGISADLPGKIPSRAWLLIECVCNSEIGHNMQDPRQPVASRDFHESHDRFGLFIRLSGVN